jgi:hypothetical protein
MAFKLRQILSMVGAAVVVGFVSVNHAMIRDWFKGAPPPPASEAKKKETKA